MNNPAYDSSCHLCSQCATSCAANVSSSTCELKFVIEYFIDFKCQDDMTSIPKNLEMSPQQEEYTINYLQESIISAINLYD